MRLPSRLLALTFFSAGVAAAFAQTRPTGSAAMSQTPATTTPIVKITAMPAATHPAESPVAEGAVLTRLGENFAFTEGSTSDAEGNVYFVDQPNNAIMKWTFDGKESKNDYSGGKMTTFMQPSGYSNGMCFDAAGNLISCADEKNQLWSIKMDGSHTVMIVDREGKLLNGPNDVWIRPDGNMYLTDPLYTRTWWKGFRTNEMQQPGQYAYYYDVKANKLTPVVMDFQQPNGIIGTPDGKTLYVSDIRGRQTFKYDIQADGTLTNKKLFCAAGSDGMTIDSAGNVYCSGRGVTIFSPEGKQIDHLDTGSSVGNMCFGGKDGHTLFIASNKTILAVQMKTSRVGPG